MLTHMKTKQQCGICETAVWDVVGDKLKKNNEYNEIHVSLDNLSKMKVAVCSKHMSPDKTALKLMTEKMHRGWQEEVDFGLGNKDWVSHVGSKLTVVGV